MIITLVLGASILLQITAALLAIRLIRVTGYRTAWALVSSAIFLMAVRRSFTLFSFFTLHPPYESDLAAELITLLISIIMLTGITLIAPLFLSIRKTSEKLEKSEIKYRTLFEYTSNPVFIIDTSGNYFDCNEAALHFLECSRDELVSKNVRDFLPPGTSEEIIGEHAPLWNNGGMIETECYIKNKAKILELTVTPIKLENKTIIYGVGRDITGRKQAEKALQKSEKEYRLLSELSAAFVNVLVSGVDDEIDMWLRRLAEFAGLDRAVLFRYADGKLTAYHNYAVDGFIPPDVDYGKYKWSMDILERGEIVPIPDIEEMPASYSREREFYRNIGVKSIVLLPLIAWDVPVGLLSFASTTGNMEWNDEILELLEPAGIVFANALDRRNRFEALRESEEKLTKFMNSATLQFSLYDSGLNIIDINDEGLRQFPDGTAKEDIIGKNVLEFAPDLKESGRYDLYLDVIKTGKPVFFENIIPHPQFGDINLTVMAFRVGDGLGMIIEDVTKRIKADEALRFLTDAIEQSSEGIAVVDMDGNLLFANAAFAELHGYTGEELLGKHLSIFHTDDQIPSVEAANRQIQDSGEFYGEIWHARRDGTAFPAQMHNSLLRDNDGNPAGMIATMRDITELKRIEEELQATHFSLQESAERFQKLAETSFDGIIVMEKGVIIEVNKAFEKMLGYKSGELIGKETIELVAPESRDISYKNIMSYYDKPYESTMITKNGSILIVDACGVKASYDGRVVRITAVRDITEQKQAEERLKVSEEKYRMLFNSSKDVIFINELTEDGYPGKIIDANAEASKKLGYNKEELLDLTPFDYTDHLELGSMLLLKDKILENGRFVFETVEVSKDGAKTDIEINASMFNLEGQPVVLSIARDITERKQAEKLTQASLREKELMLQEIHHRTKNNLQVILSLLDMANLRISNTLSKNLIIDVSNKIYTMSFVHTQLYQSSSFDTIDMESQILEIFDHLYEVYSGEARVIPVINAPAVEMPITYAMPCMLVLTELISNILKHAFIGKQEGTLEVSMKKSSKGTISITVRDDGIGLPDEVDIYKTGTMGLKLTRNLVQQQLSGKIGVKRGKGTEFNIEFDII